jgi:hypothetical protein
MASAVVSSPVLLVDQAAAVQVVMEQPALQQQPVVQHPVTTLTQVVLEN